MGFYADFWFLLFSDKRNPPPERRNNPQVQTMMHLRADTQVGPYDIRSAFAAGDRKGRPYANARPYKSQFIPLKK